MTPAPADSREESAGFETHAVADGRFAEKQREAADYEANIS